MARLQASTIFSFFFFTATATTEIYTLSLHDALPIFGESIIQPALVDTSCGQGVFATVGQLSQFYNLEMRSEEHTSELQSLTNLVCRLLLEKKKPELSASPRVSSD